MSIILGIDPGTTTIGYAVIALEKNTRTLLDYGVIHTPPRIAVSDKLMIIADDIRSVVDRFSPNVCAIERLFFYKNITTAIDVAQARGVICETIARKGILLREFTPLEVKKGICGNGTAKKPQIQKTLQMLFTLSDLPQDDAADAIALAYIGSLHLKVGP